MLHQRRAFRPVGDAMLVDVPPQVRNIMCVMRLPRRRTGVVGDQCGLRLAPRI